MVSTSKKPVAGGLKAPQNLCRVCQRWFCACLKACHAGLLSRVLAGEEKPLCTVHLADYCFLD
jgi:hypothetical protein